MFFKALSAKAKMFENTDDYTDDYFTPRHRAQSTSHLLSPDSATIRSMSPRQDRSTPSPTSSISSLAPTNSPKNTLSSFLKISSPNRKTTSSPPSEDRFIMTIIRSPSTSSQQRAPVNDPVGTPVTNEELSNNNKFFKSKVTAALNHMKYRKFNYLNVFKYCFLMTKVGW
jgi:hypothetical protein